MEGFSFLRRTLAMKTATKALVTVLAVLAMNSAMSAEPAAEQVELKDGSTLFLHPDGTGRMVDQHGKPMSMADGVEMEAADGRVILMQNKRIWVRYGPPGKGSSVPKID
jgi:hypothetical protein